MVHTRSGRSLVTDSSEGKKKHEKKTPKKATKKKRTLGRTAQVVEAQSVSQAEVPEKPLETSVVTIPTNRAVEKKKPTFSLLRRKPQTILTAKSTPNQKNELSELIPGYTAAMELESNAKECASIGDLYKKAQATDKSTRNFLVQQPDASVAAAAKTDRSLYSANFKTAHQLKHKTQDQPLTAGDGWFNMVPTEMTDQVKADLSLIQNRTYLDPKRFYKKSDSSNGKMLQVGTVIEGAAEFYSSRLTNKQQRSTLVEQVMADPMDSAYAQRKFKQMQQFKSQQGRKRAANKKKYRRKGRKGY